jgi:hypothetical protein
MTTKYQAVEATAPYESGAELATTAPAAPSIMPAFYPVNVRGAVFLAAHQGGEAAGTFERSSLMVGLWSITSSAHSRSCKSAEPLPCRETAKAKAAYQGFLISGRTPTLTFPSSNWPRRTTRSWSRLPVPCM